MDIEEKLISLAEEYVNGRAFVCSQIYHNIHLRLIHTLDLDHRCNHVVLTNADTVKIAEYWDRQSDICSEIRSVIDDYRFTDCTRYVFGYAIPLESNIDKMKKILDNYNSDIIFKPL